MKRYVMTKLQKWKDSPDRKPLVIRGARQVGKTWIMKEFGKNFYDNFVYCNFDEDSELKSIPLLHCCHLKLNFTKAFSLVSLQFNRCSKHFLIKYPQFSGFMI